MEGHNKHFSHTHNLNLHQMPQGIKITCSGCNSAATATAYACWQCNFFLHEHCYRASRSFKHPSHPAHPLTLVPYPTYPSNSFYCNSCNQIGTGFSYSCADCEYDLHVQCAYNISKSSFLTPETLVVPLQNLSISSQFTAFPNQSLKHETLHNFNAQHAYMPHQTVTTTPHDSSMNYPSFSPQFAYMPHQTPNQETAPSFNPQHVSTPQETPTRQHDPNNHIPIYPPINETMPSFNAPQYIPNSHLPTYHPINETMPSFNAPQTIPNSHLPTYPPINETMPSFNAPQTIPNSHLPTYPPINETMPNFNPPANEAGHSFSAPQNSHIPQAVVHEPMNPNVPTPNLPPKAETFQTTYNRTESSPKADEPMNPNVPTPNLPPKPETLPTTYNRTESTTKTDQSTKVKTRGIMHFSHPHALRLVKLKDGEEGSITCSACEDNISDSGYSCPVSSCNFHLDKSCFKLAEQIQHKSHTEHPLTLLPISNDKYGRFICSACFTDCVGFTYHCNSYDEFNLHVKCASSPETVKRKDHEHPLNLVYSSPVKDEEHTFFCDVCGGVVQESCWSYRCEKCDYGTHVDCVNCEDNPVEETPADESGSSTGDPLLDAVLDSQSQMLRNQIRLDMARQNSLFMMNLGHSISNNW